MDQFESSDNVTDNASLSLVQNSITSSSSKSYFKGKDIIQYQTQYSPTEYNAYKPIPIKHADFVNLMDDSDDEPMLVSLGKRSTNSQKHQLMDVQIKQLKGDIFNVLGGYSPSFGDDSDLGSPEYVPFYPTENTISKQYSRGSKRGPATPKPTEGEAQLHINQQKTLKNLQKNQSQQINKPMSVQYEQPVLKDSVKDLIQEQKRKLEEQRLKNIKDQNNRSQQQINKLKAQQSLKLQHQNKIQKKGGQLATGLKTLERMNNTAQRHSISTKTTQKPQVKQKPAANINILEMLGQRENIAHHQVSERSHSQNSMQGTSSQSPGLGTSFKRNDSVNNTTGLDTAWKIRQNSSLPGLEVDMQPEKQLDLSQNQTNDVQYGKLIDTGVGRQSTNLKTQQHNTQQKQQSQQQLGIRTHLNTPPKPNKLTQITQQQKGQTVNAQYQQYGKMQVVQADSPQAPKCKPEISEKQLEKSEFDQKVEALDSRLYSLSKSKNDIQAAGVISLDLSINQKRGLGQVARLLMKHSEPAMNIERRQALLYYMDFFLLQLHLRTRQINLPNYHEVVSSPQERQKLEYLKKYEDYFQVSAEFINGCMAEYNTIKFIYETMDLIENFSKIKEDIQMSNYYRHSFKGGVLVNVIEHQSFDIDNWPDILGWAIKTDYHNPAIVLTQDEDDNVIATQQYQEVMELRKQRDQQLRELQDKQRVEYTEHRKEEDRQRQYQQFQSGLSDNLKQKQGNIYQRWQQKMQQERQQQQLARQEAQKSQPQIQQRFQFQAKMPDVQQPYTHDHQQQQQQQQQQQLSQQQQQQQYRWQYQTPLNQQNQYMGTMHNNNSSSGYIQQQHSVQQGQPTANTSLRQDNFFSSNQFQNEHSMLEPDQIANKQEFFLQRKRLSPEQQSRIIDWLRQSPSPQKKSRSTLPKGIYLTEASKNQPFGQPPLPDQSPTIETPPFTPPNDEFKPSPVSPPPLPGEISQIPAVPLHSESSALLKEDKFGRPHTPTEPPLPEGQLKPPLPEGQPRSPSPARVFVDGPPSPPPEPIFEYSGNVHTPPVSPPANDMHIEYTPEGNKGTQNGYNYGQIQEIQPQQQYQDKINQNQERYSQYRGGNQYNKFEEQRHRNGQYSLGQQYTPATQQTNVYQQQQQPQIAQDYYQSQTSYSNAYQQYGYQQDNEQYLENNDMSYQGSMQQDQYTNQYLHPFNHQQYGQYYHAQNNHNSLSYQDQREFSPKFKQSHSQYTSQQPKNEVNKNINRQQYRYNS